MTSHYCMCSVLLVFQASLLPVNVFKQQAEEEKGETARLVCIQYIVYSMFFVSISTIKYYCT